MDRPIEILPIIVDKARKASPHCLRRANDNLERHQLGFDGEHVASKVLKEMGYKNIRTTSHKAVIDITTSRTVWEIKAVGNGAKDWKMTVKTHQRLKKMALAKKTKKDLKSMLLVMNDKAEVYIRNGVGGFRHTTMKKVKDIKDWRKTYGHGASHRLLEKSKVKWKVKDAVGYKELNFGEKGTGRSHWSVARFIKKRETMPKKYYNFVTHYSEKEYKKMGAKVFLSDSAKSGYAIDKHGDLMSVFSLPGAHEGPTLMQSAIRNGAKKLDCFDSGFLPKFYEKYGFKEINRIKWGDKFAPSGWNYKRDGRPDVVFMRLKATKQIASTPRGIPFAPASTVKEAEKIAKKYIAKDVSYAYLETANEVNQTLFVLEKKYKYGKLSSIRGMYGGNNGYADIGKGIEKGHIAFGKSLLGNNIKAVEKRKKKCLARFQKTRDKVFKEQAKACDKVIKALKTGEFNHGGIHSSYLFPQDNIGQTRSLIVHEFGHLLHATNKTKIHKYLGIKRTGKIASDVWDTVEEDAYSGWQKYFITDRGSYNVTETIAENFACYEMGATAGMDKKMIKMFDLLSKGKL